MPAVYPVDSSVAGGSAAPATLATTEQLTSIRHVLMHMDWKCKMGISFWPSMSFKSSRPPQPATARLLLPGDLWLSGRLPADSAGTSGPPAAEGPAPNGEATPNAVPAESVAPAAANGASALNGDGDSSGSTQRDAEPAAGASAPGGGGGDDDSTGGGGGGAAATENGGRLAGVVAGRRLLFMDFSKDPPDEFHVGAQFMCGLPFPFMSIRTTKLAGTVDVDSGEVTLEFVSEFLTQTGNKEPTVLEIKCDLTTEEVEVLGKKIKGERLKDGRCTLIAHALVPPTKSRFANFCLWLPAAARAVLPMRLEFLPATAAHAAAGTAAAAGGSEESSGGAPSDGAAAGAAPA